MIIQTLTIALLLSHSTLGSPTERDDKTIDLFEVADRPSANQRATGARVAEWDDQSVVNPEELGDYSEGDIAIPLPSKLNDGNAVVRLWPGGRVYYEIVPDFDQQDLGQIKRAMDHISEHTCIEFAPLAAKQPDFVKFTSERTGCWTSGLGRLGGQQVVNLQRPSCLRRAGSIVHEIMHVLGFGHEHNRPDRDRYVDILWENVNDGYAGNFNKSDVQTVTLGLPYDPYSIMHYSSRAFANDKQLNTIKPKSTDVNVKQIGQRNALTSLDIQKINKLYEKECSA